MADKQISERDSDSRGKTPAPAQYDPDNDVTSELSGLIAKAFGDDSDTRSNETRITSARLVSHGEPESDDALEPGYLLSERYEIVERVHSGGMSHVYKAIDRRRHAGQSRQIHVAIKMLRRAVSERDEYRLLLEKEASKARSLSHPNIIKIFDFDAHEDQFFLVMEWLEGESLRTLLQRSGDEPLSPTFCWTVIEAVADALQHSHSSGVIHADVNPSNIFVTTTHDIKLLDFGVARFADDEENSPEDLTAWVTPSYASPQVLSGLSPVAQDDVFSLACVAYRCFAGSHPFDGKLSIAAQRDNVEVRPVAVLSKQEWSALDRCLAYTREERPDSASIFQRSLATANAGTPFEQKFTPRTWSVLAAAVVATVLIIGWWSQSGNAPTDVTPVTPEIAATSPQDPDAAAESTTSEPVSVVDSLLTLARQAVSAEQLVLPANDNARDWYRQALAIEANNQEALAGLRAISDVFVEEARTAIDAGNPQTAQAALAAAAETDAGNPVVAMLEELLVSQGNAQLTAARLAIVNGNGEAAGVALAQAEQYAHIEAEAIESLRTQLTALNRNAALRSDLAVVDAHIAAGRLLQPAGDNAYEALIPLRDTYGANAELTEASRRLAERLLTRAALASASGNLAEADSLVSAAASLGGADEEVDRVRAAIAAAAAAAAAAEVADAARGEDAAESSNAASEASATPPAVNVAAAETLATGASRDDAAPTDIGASTPMTATGISEDVRVDSAPSIDTAQSDVSALPTDDGAPSATADGAAVAAPTAAASRGIVTESELPLTESDGQVTTPQQAVAGSGAIDMPASAPGAPAVGGSAQSTDSQRPNLNDAERPRTLAGSGPSVNSDLPVSAPLEQAVAETNAAEASTATIAARSNSVERSEQSMALQLRDLGLTRYSAPTYPQGAKRRGLSGYVNVAFDITPEGRTNAIEILGGEPAGVFDRSAARAIRLWRFEPRDETIRGSITLRYEIEE
ncbi:MAG: TonB family protein [Woeseiaceae bacterium]|nr:TonB family protein [Woeseiaceae bacterium]